MGNQKEDEFDEFDEDSNLVKDLRRQIKALSKDKSDLSTKLTTIEGSFRERSLADTLTAKGVNAKVAKFIPPDVTGDEAITKWLDENAEAFNFTVKAEEKTQTITPTTNTADIAESKRLQALGQGAKSPSNMGDITARLASAKTDDELNALFDEAKQLFL